MVMEMEKKAKGFMDYAKDTGYDILHYNYNQVIISNKDIEPNAARVSFIDGYIYIIPLIKTDPFKYEILADKGLFYYDVDDKEVNNTEYSHDGLYEKIIMDIVSRLSFNTDDVSTRFEYSIYEETGLFSYNQRTGEVNLREVQKAIENMPENVIFKNLAKITTEYRFVDENSKYVFSILKFTAESGSYFTYDTKYKRITGTTVLIPSCKRVAALGNLFNEKYVQTTPSNATDNKEVSFNDMNSYIRKEIPRTATGDIDYKQSPRVIYTVNTQEYISSNDKSFYPVNPEINAYGIIYSVKYNDVTIWNDEKITLPGCFSEINIYDLLPIGTSEIVLIQQIVKLNNITSLDAVSTSLSYSTTVKVIKK